MENWILKDLMECVFFSSFWKGWGDSDFEKNASNIIAQVINTLQRFSTKRTMPTPEQHYPLKLGLRLNDSFFFPEALGSTRKHSETLGSTRKH